MTGREKECKWYFADQPNVQEVGPNNAMEQNFKRHPYASLVRESIQNSLDAVLDKSEPVRMEFSFKEMRGADYPNFFELREHIRGCIDYYSNNHNAKVIYEPMLRLFENNKLHDHLGYIRISDYNTKGMSYKEGDTNCNFYAFVRSAGVSSKDDKSAGGSFGFGKAAYYLLSPISTIIVSTCTTNYDKFFEGSTSLCTHTYHGIKKVAFGYYDDQNGKPISDEAAIPAQFRRSDPGTDINILGFDMKYTDEAVKEMTEAVLRNFWMTIYNGKLEVKINDLINITKDNIADLMEEFFKETDDNTRKAGYYNPRPYFDAVHLSKSSNKYLFFEDSLPLLGHVKLYLKKSKGSIDKIAYMRAPLMLVYSKKNKTNYGMYGVFVCDDTTEERGNDLLRKLENPAHDEWKPNNWRIDGKVHGMGRIIMKEIDDFITKCLNTAFSLKNKIAIDIKGLEDFLYIPTCFDEDEDLDASIFQNGNLEGRATGYTQDEGCSYTTDILKEDKNPTYNKQDTTSSVGNVLINKTTNATNDTGGDLRSGHGDSKKKTNAKGIQRPGDAKEKRTENESGEHGVFARPIIIPYRSFSQVEDKITYHYIILHSTEEINNVRLHFFAVGEERDEELQLAESNIGNISGNVIRDIHLHTGRFSLKVRFSDNMKHTIKLSAEEMYEI